MRDVTSAKDLLPQLLRRQSDENPGRILVRDVQGETLSCRQLDDGAQLWASAYWRLGIEAGDIVVSITPLCLDYFRSWIGLSWLGAIATPLNTDQRGPLLRDALHLLRPAAVVCTAEYVERLAEIGPDLPEGIVAVVLGEPDVGHDALPFDLMTRTEFFADCPILERSGGPEPWDIATILCTSGTSGPSKAVMVPWAQLQLTAEHSRSLFEAGADDVFYCPSPAYHIGAHMFLWQTALANGEIVIRERFSTTQWWADVERYGCTLAAFLGALVHFATGSLSHLIESNPLRRVLMMPVIPEVDTFQDRFGVEVVTAYSMTEVSGPITSTGIRMTDELHAICGRLQPGFEARIVDDHDMEVPTGDVGELILRAEAPWTMNLGYYGMPDATVEAWRNGWFHTGDAFRRDEDGNYCFVDRLKDCIRRRGENISSFEVESLVTGHPGVAECSAVAVSSELAEDEVKIVVVRQSDAQMTPDALLRWLTPRTPRFMLPRYVEFVDELPKTPTGKVQKHVLRDRGIGPTTWDRENATTATSSASSGH